MWRRYYEREATIKRFVPEEDPYEVHRCRFAWSLMPKKPASVLDVGCGDGYWCSVLRSRGIARVVGVDISPARVIFAAQHVAEASFGQVLATNLPFADKTFDVATCVEVLEHVIDPEAVMRELGRVARNYVIITVPHDRQPMVVLCPHCLNTFPVDGHLHAFTPEKLSQMCCEAGLEVVRVERHYVLPHDPQSGLAVRLVRDTIHAGRMLLARMGLSSPPRPKYLGVLCRPR